jgi:hypothetical protein
MQMQTTLWHFVTFKKLQNDLGCFNIDGQSKPFIDHPSSYI